MDKKIKDRVKKYDSASIAFKNKMEELIQIIRKCTIMPDDTVETGIVKMYLLCGEVKEVTDYINNQGYRVKTTSHIGERKYTTNDITSIVDKKNPKVDAELYKGVELMRYIDRMLIKMNINKLLKEHKVDQ